MKAYSVIQHQKDGKDVVLFSSDDEMCAYRKAIGLFRKKYVDKQRDRWPTLSSFDRDVITSGFKNFYTRITREFTGLPEVVVNN